MRETSVVPTRQNLIKAISEKSFVLQYQPMIRAKGNQLYSFEALVGWKINNEKILSADLFVPMIEKNNLIQPFTHVIIEMLFHQYEILKSLDINLSIDLSNNALGDLFLIDEIIEIAEYYRVVPDKISFELTETSVMREPKLAMDVLTRFRSKGFRVVLDSFGKGYSSLIELHRLPFNGIKMDKSFSANLTKDVQAKKIVKSIIDLAHSLELKIVADGVATKAVFTLLKTMGCDIIQGDYISTPLESAEVAKWIKKNCSDNMCFKHRI